MRCRACPGIRYFFAQYTIQTKKMPGRLPGIFFV